MRTMVLATVALAGFSVSPALADTLNCTNRDGTVRVVADIAFTPDRDGGEISGVRVETPNIVMSTAEADVLAFQTVSYNRIEVGLESPNVGPMTFTMDLVRASEADGNGGPDTGIVVAGVARVASIGTTTLECSGW